MVHVSRNSGYSSYGRYVVIEHDLETPAYHTLYAHLASLADTIVRDARVETGTVLGIMGVQPLIRFRAVCAHVHFEAVFRLTDDLKMEHGSKFTLRIATYIRN